VLHEIFNLIRVFAGEKQKEQCDELMMMIVSLTKQQGEVG
jgi:hypothetical protein